MESLNDLIKRLQQDVDRAERNPDLSGGNVVITALDLQRLLNELEELEEEIHSIEGFTD